jgi:hypothetical protein
MDHPGKTIISGTENRKFSTEVRICSGRHDIWSGYRERLLSQVFAALPPNSSQDAFHSFALFSTCQLATLGSPFPFNLDCDE